MLGTSSWSLLRYSERYILWPPLEHDSMYIVHHSVTNHRVLLSSFFKCPYQSCSECIDRASSKASRILAFPKRAPIRANGGEPFPLPLEPLSNFSSLLLLWIDWGLVGISQALLEFELWTVFPLLYSCFSSNHSFFIVSGSYGTRFDAVIVQRLITKAILSGR